MQQVSFNDRSEFIISHIWLLMQAVAEDFYKVDSISIFSPQSAFKQADLQAMC